MKGEKRNNLATKGKARVAAICPLYNAAEYLPRLHESLLKQDGVNLSDIHYIITKGSDKTEEMVRALKHCTCKVIEPSEFSHSKTRELAAVAARAEIIVFISQDIKIKRSDWLGNLVAPIIKGECAAAFSRQLCEDNSLEKYTRELNYPAESRLVTDKDLDELGLRTFFFSDAAGAIRREVFIKLHGYDEKDLPINEDMYFAHKLIKNGYAIKYCADSEVVHAHQLSAKEQYRRYYNTGKFFAMNAELDQYQTKRTGAGLARYVLKRAVSEKNWPVLRAYLPNMVARYVGMQNGKRAGRRLNER